MTASSRGLGDGAPRMPDQEPVGDDAAQMAANRSGGDGAPPERDDRTWLIRKSVHGPYDAIAASILGPQVEEATMVVPVSRLARVQERYEQMCSKEMSAWQKIEVLSERLGQAREALKEIASAGERVPDWRSMADCARAALAASGVTAKGDGTDG